MDLFLLICRQGAGATVRGAVMAADCGLLAAQSAAGLGGHARPVLEWIGVMNTTVLTAGTARM